MHSVSLILLTVAVMMARVRADLVGLVFDRTQVKSFFFFSKCRNIKIWFLKLKVALSR